MRVKFVGANWRNMKDVNNTKVKDANESTNGEDQIQMKDTWTQIYRLSS